MANNPPAPTELPGNLTTPASVVVATNDRIRDIISWVTGGYVANPATAATAIDTNQNNIVNLADPINPQDAVNLRTLKRFQQPSVAATPSSGAPGAVYFRAEARGYAELTIEDLVVSGPSGLTAVQFMAFAVDETDIGLAGVTGVALSANAAATSANLTNQQGLAAAGNATNPFGRLGRTIQVGDFLLIDFEIVRVTAVTATQLMVYRGAFLGSTVAAHTATAAYYKLFPFPFSAPANPNTFGQNPLWLPLGAPATMPTSNVPTRWGFAAPNLCIAAIAAFGVNGSTPGPVTLVNYSVPLIQQAVLGANSWGASPGLRTMSGAAYTDIGCSGTLSAGQFADVIARVQAWHSIRNVFGYVMTAPGNANLRAYVLYYSPDRSVGALVQELDFTEGSYVSSSVDPDGLQMPVGPQLQTWPPNILSGIGMAGNGRAQWPLAINGLPEVLEAGGWWDLVVDRADGSSADLCAVIQV